MLYLNCQIQVYHRPKNLKIKPSFYIALQYKKKVLFYVIARNQTFVDTLKTYFSI